MENTHQQTVVTESAPQLPILVIDKNGHLGRTFAESLQHQLTVVFATARAIKGNEHLIPVSFKSKIPRLPDNTYSHIFVFYNGEVEILDMLSSLIKKAHDTHAKVIFMIPLSLSTPRLFKRLFKEGHPALQLIVYGEIFDNALSYPNELSYYIQQIRSHNTIVIPNDGLGQLYPVLIDDVLLGIVTVAFRADRQFKTYLLFPNHSFSQVSVARIFQTIDPDIDIDYKKKRYKENEYHIPHGVPLLTDYRLDTKLRAISLGSPRKKIRHRQERFVHYEADEPKPKITLVQKNPEEKKERALIGGLLFVAVFIAPLLVTLSFAFGGAGLLASSVKNIEKGEFAKAEEQARYATHAFTAADALTSSLVIPAIIFPDQKDSLVSGIETGAQVAETEVALLGSVKQLQRIYADQSLDPKNDFLGALATMKNALLTVQKLQAEGKLPESVEKKLEANAATLQLLEGTIDTWPALLGFEGKKSYLILFQNNMELRPGGGFIGSYGLISVENGVFDELTVHDVYDADGQLKTHIEPPFGLRRYLGASHWYLRDSNFALDFRENALQASQFLNLETGESVDGIVAIDTSFLKQLLGVLGTVTVSDYEEEVTADNFYLLTQTHVEKDFFPGSTQKKDFLRSLTNAMMIELLEKKDYSYEKLLLATEESIRQKHLMVAFADNGVQNVFTVNGMSSALQDTREQAKNTYLDFLSVVDANVGANKANFYVKRAIDQNVTISDSGEILTRVTASYTNTSKPASPFGGTYKNYVRFVLPSTAQVQGISINGKEQSIVPAVTDPVVFTQAGFIPPTGLEVNQTFNQGKKVVGFYFPVPMGENTKVVIDYTTPRSVKTEATDFGYSLRLFKQPGAHEEPYTLTVSYPATFSLIGNSEGISDLGSKFVYETSRDEDIDLRASFAKR